MADHSLIEWTDATWNPITGCSVVSPGCADCYAMRLAGTRLQHHWSRKGLTQPSKAGPVWTGELRFNEEWLYQPLTWKQPRRIFVCAHGDLFAAIDGWIMRVLDVMARAQLHTLQVLTKRPDRMLNFFRRWADVDPEQDWDFKDARGPDAVRAAHKSGRGQLFADMLEAMGEPPPGAAYPLFDWSGGMSRWSPTFRHIWLGVSVEDQARADERREAMRALSQLGWRTWVSYEPALGPVDWTGWEFLSWMVSGGESGDRPSHPAWHRTARDFCAAHDIPYFLKQWGSWAPVCVLDDATIDTLYAPPPRLDPEAITKCLVDSCVLHADGSRYDVTTPMAFAAGADAMTMFKVGKKRAGRTLDGVEHNAMPGIPR
ncbi:DUF5131 family protein [Vineibacter terrae]|uniref:DUF5131 family protein n=1 Tax=Vineibacter terrae TaxID=2586908 RepID=A0A5C8PFG3_9HYPH|nr:DUF5131 family protein [Vineibacter terrae]TXL72517.1 DUF5131 family protein [Vineibacter terrae]